MVSQASLLGRAALAALLFTGAGAEVQSSHPPPSGLRGPKEEAIVLANEALRVAVSPRTGEIEQLESRQPTPLSLLDHPQEPLGLWVMNLDQNWAEPLNVVHRWQIDERRRIRATVAPAEHPVVEADLTYDLSGDCLSLKAQVRFLADDASSYRLVWGQPSVSGEELFSYPYSEGLASTGGRQFLRLGSAGSLASRQTFPPETTVEVELTVLSQWELDAVTSLRYRLQPNGDGYYFDLIRRGEAVRCWMVKDGKWVTQGNGLGVKEHSWALGRRHRLKIVGRADGFDCYLDDEPVFHIADPTFTAGAIGLKQHYNGTTRLHAVTVRQGERVLLQDDFQGYPLGREPELLWVVRAGLVSVEDGGREWAGYPARFITLPDRYVVWGQLDLNHPVILNRRETKAPWLAIGPKGLRKGEHYTFSVVLKALPRPQFARRDALRWYVQRMFDSDPFFQGPPVRLAYEISRTFPEGNFVFYSAGYSLLGQRLQPEQVRQMEERLQALRFTNVIFTDWYSIPWTGRERPRADLAGAWLNPCTREVQLGRRLKEEIARLHRQGFKVYLYFWPVTLSFNPRNEAKLRQLIDFAKRCVDFYQADGLGYDMNWHVHKQVLKLQYELFHWLREKHPEGRIIVDYGFGTPSQLYADTLISEFGLWMYGLPHNNVIESFTALRTNVTNLIYFEGPLRELKQGRPVRKIGIGKVNVRSVEEWYHTYVQLVMQSLALGGSWSDSAASFSRPEFEPLVDRTTLAHFSARTVATPLVTETGCAECRPDDGMVAVWADEGNLLMAVYRHRLSWKPEPGFFRPEEVANPLTVTVHRSALARNGLRRIPPLKVVVLDPEGRERAGARFRCEVSPAAVQLTGDLGEGELLLAWSKR
ncbi:MAG TPA: hypothetical protein EYP85_12620 [Armatimonadetes bacterium]|nr:hypothetical protein [Armatimonadota bacterium]